MSFISAPANARTPPLGFQRSGDSMNEVTVRRSDGEVTRERILRSAEALFAADGFAGVSVRQITGAAGVDLALIKYYFGSKEGLFHAVLAKRVDKMSERRLDGLGGIEVKPGDRKSIARLLEVFIQPMIGDTPAEAAELRNYRLLIALVTNSKTWQDTIFKQHYDPVAIQFVEALQKALPDAKPQDVVWGFSFFLGSLVNAFAETGRIDRLSNGECRSEDLREACRQLVNYSTGAFLSLSG